MFEKGHTDKAFLYVLGYIIFLFVEINPRDRTEEW
jgi:hypothetical protein